MKKIIVFGTGRRMYEYMMRDAFNNFDIVAFCDNDKSKHGEKINGVDIISPENIYKYEFEEIYIASDLYYSEIREQLIRECGIKSDVIKKVCLETNKYEGEMSFWKAYYVREGFDNSVYRKMMLNILGEENDECFKDKVVVDFGCGPQGSLVWTDAPKTKIGVDVLATKYFEAFPEELQNHNMIYVQSSEEVIPLPSEYADYLITINSLDHVYNLDVIANEIRRILKQGGTLLGSFNLNEPETECEPQKLTIDKLDKYLLSRFDIIECKLYIKGKGTINHIKDLDAIDDEIGNSEGILWIKAVKK